MKPQVDINLFVYNNARYVGAAIESVLAQTWKDIKLTLIDDGSTDGTTSFLERVVAQDRRIRLKRNRTNGGAVDAFQKAFWIGDADFVMPKSGDDVLAPNFIENIMDVLLDRPTCAMCHAGGGIFTGESEILGVYPPSHNLAAVGDVAVERACHVMARYTSSPSFWGIYRREAVDRLARIRYRAGWDHALLAELALYGEIRSVPEPLYWRRDGGKPVLTLARMATERGSRKLNIDDPITELHWRMPLTVTALAHLETFAVARISDDERRMLFRWVPEIFRGRWLPALRREWMAFRGDLPAIVASARSADGPERSWIAKNLSDLLHGVEVMFPGEDLSGSFRNMEHIREYADPNEAVA